MVLPLVLGGVAHSAVIGRNLLPWLKKPLDFGARLGGEPLLGANKTFHGLVVMPSASALSAWTLALVWEPNGYPGGFAFLTMPSGAFRFGMLAGTADALAELPNSFVKRLLHIPAGCHPRGIGKALSYLVDQVDSVVGIVLVMWAVYRPPHRLLASIFVTGSLAHIAIDIMLYLLGVKKLNEENALVGGKYPRPNSACAPQMEGSSMR